MADHGAPREPSAPRGGLDVPRSLGIGDVARRAGLFRWVESRVAEILGGWIGSVPEPDATALLGAHCHMFAWHADLWLDRVPRLPGTDPDALTLPANAGMDDFFDALAESGTSIEKLVGVYRVLVPDLVAAYSQDLDATDEITDAPTARVLGLVLRDHVHCAREGEALIRSLVGSTELETRAAAHQSRLAAMLAAAGGVAGPTTSVN